MQSIKLRIFPWKPFVDVKPIRTFAKFACRLGPSTLRSHMGADVFQGKTQPKTKSTYLHVHLKLNGLRNDCNTPQCACVQGWGGGDMHPGKKIKANIARNVWSLMAALEYLSEAHPPKAARRAPFSTKGARNVAILRHLSRPELHKGQHQVTACAKDAQGLPGSLLQTHR